MPRGASKSTPEAISGVLYTNDRFTGTRVGSLAWFDWLSDGSSFSFNACTVRAEKRRNGLSWYAFKKRSGVLHKVYVGRTAALSRKKLEAATAALNEHLF